MKSLTALQRDLLVIVGSSDERTVPDIADAIQAYYAEDLDEDRVRRNLSKLEERGFVQDLDSGSDFLLTEQGERALVTRRIWEDSLEPPI